MCHISEPIEDKIIEQSKLFAINTTVHEKLVSEALRKNLLLIGYSARGNTYRLYKFISCGHESEILTNNVRKNKPLCKECYENSTSRRLESSGVQYLNGQSYRVVQCGHVVTIKYPRMLTGKFECKECLNDINKQLADSKGLEMLGDSNRGSLYKRYRVVTCGHHVELQKSNIKHGKFSCCVCLKEKLSNEATQVGITLVGESSKGAVYREYLFPCGHSSHLKVEKVRDNLVNCFVCGDTSWTKPSNTYVFKLTDGESEWLKIGYARSVNYRKTRYGLPRTTECVLLLTKSHATGRDAALHEDEIFKSISQWKLPADRMKKYLTMSGATECYDIAALDVVKEFFK